MQTFSMQSRRSGTLRQTFYRNKEFHRPEAVYRRDEALPQAAKDTEEGAC